jgi:hypothetical protein
MWASKTSEDVIDEITELAGTSDADHEVLKAAASLVIEARLSATSWKREAELNEEIAADAVRLATVSAPNSLALLFRETLAMDKGPWKMWANDKGLCVASEDFDHDVVLYVNGDFADEFQRANYCVQK